jgi:hypothetical protein
MAWPALQDPMIRDEKRRGFAVDSQGAWALKSQQVTISRDLTDVEGIGIPIAAWANTSVGRAPLCSEGKSA